MATTSRLHTRRGSARVVIVGGGIAGISTAVRIAQAGFPVSVLEASRLGDGATTRNQGWLHSGAWFAPHRPELARLCYESLEQTLKFAPRCAELTPAPMVYLMSRSESSPTRWSEAWATAHIPHRGLSPQQVFELFPTLAISQVQQAFQLPDRSIQIDLLLQQLAAAAEKAGVEIRPHSRVDHLIHSEEDVRGVVLAGGEELAARLVILAGNAKGGVLYPGFGTQAVGPQQDIALTALKTHLLGVQPVVSETPLCVVDADGLNHLPHRSMSVFGTNRWLPARHGEDQQVIPAEVERVWQHVQRLFPDITRNGGSLAWAGTTIQAMRINDLEEAQFPLPLVIDHQRELQPVRNLISIFPGRATLWPQIADAACRLVQEKLESSPQTIAQPPWGTVDSWINLLNVPSDKTEPWSASSGEPTGVAS